MFSMIKELQAHHRNLKKHINVEGETVIIDISFTKRQPREQFYLFLANPPF